MQLTCWNCGGQRSRPAPTGEPREQDFVCPGCGVIQPPIPDRTYFECLGFPPALQIDGRELGRRFRQLSRILHPDRYSGRTARERRLAMEQMTTVNDAHRILRDPLKRAEHLLALHGIEVSERGGADEAFLMEMMELREEVETAAGDPEGARAMVERLEQDIRSSLDCLGELVQQQTGESWDDADRQRALGALTRLKYLTSARSDLAGRLEREQSK